MQAQAQKKARMLLQQQLLQQQQKQQQQQRQQHQQQSSEIVIQKQGNQQEQSVEDRRSSLQEQDISDDEQFQIITLKDCEENSEEQTDSSTLKQRVPSYSESEKFVSADATQRMPNNVRLNGPQESFIDPLNAAFLFPTSDPGEDQVDKVPSSSESSMLVEQEVHEACSVPVQPVLPIPDLLAEAVPKVNIDMVSAPNKTALPTKVSIRVTFPINCMLLILSS